MNQGEDPVLQIIEEVASKHGIALDPNDPILMVYTINQHLMRSGARIQQAMLKKYQKDIEEHMELWKVQAYRQGDQAMQSTLDATREIITATVRVETEMALKAVILDLSKHQRSANLNLFASMLTLAASAIVLWTLLSH